MTNSNDVGQSLDEFGLVEPHILRSPSKWKPLIILDNGLEKGLKIHGQVEMLLQNILWRGWGNGKVESRDCRCLGFNYRKESISTPRSLLFFMFTGCGVIHTVLGEMCSNEMCGFYVK